MPYALETGYRHCLRRVMERFGYKLKIMEYLQICGRILQGKEKLVGYGEGTALKYRLEIADFICIGVFDPETGTLRTIHK
jgi:hypothetical protein